MNRDVLLDACSTNKDVIQQAISQKWYWKSSSGRGCLGSQRDFKSAGVRCVLTGLTDLLADLPHLSLVDNAHRQTAVVAAAGLDHTADLVTGVDLLLKSASNLSEIWLEIMLWRGLRRVVT